MDSFLFGARFLFLISISKVFLFGLFFVVIAINCVLLNELKICSVRCDLFLAVLRQKACCLFSICSLTCVTSLCSNCSLRQVVVNTSWFYKIAWLIMCFHHACFISCIYDKFFCRLRFLVKVLLRLLKNLSGTDISQPGSRVLRQPNSSLGSID